MVKAVSNVSKKLASRDVLFAPGGRDAILKRPTAQVNRRPTGLKWAKVIAPAYISGSPIRLSLYAYEPCAMAIACMSSHVSLVYK